MINADVVVLHGILWGRWHMLPLTHFLSSKGYNVYNVAYPSTQFSLERLVEIVWDRVHPLLRQERCVHFVGYSMGGLLVRALLHQYAIPQLGRVVLLATPNHGSEVADFLHKTWLFKKIFGPAGQQLTTDGCDGMSLLGKVVYPCGVIAGNFSWNPIARFTNLPDQNDGQVSVESTQVTGMHDHIVVRASHILFPCNQVIRKQVDYFLKQGSFERAVRVT